MSFTSQIFLFYFLPIFLILYYVRGRRFHLLLLTIFSYIYYGWWDWRFLFLIFLSTIVNYYCARRIKDSASSRVRKSLLIVAIGTNLSLLGFFKYFMFFNASMSGIFSFFGYPYPDTLLSLKLVLPIGISFYTFQSMSYTIDVYRGVSLPTKSLLDFACYVSMFPQLVAGPIVRYHHLAHQLHHPVFTPAKFYLGLQFFILGLAKKVLIADSVSIVADAFFDAESLAPFSSIDAVFGMLAYTVQIYFDFSGYSDMAVGLGYFCGFSLPVNFHSPYKAKSLAEFWRRWHISLSTWLRDYIYISFGGSRKGAFKTYRNLIVTFLLGGLWHGANWTFVVWGAYHGILVIAERMMGKNNPIRYLPHFLQTLLTFLIVALGWTFFRARDVESGIQIVWKIFSCDISKSLLLEMGNQQVGFAALGVGMFIIFFFKNTWEIKTVPYLIKTLLLVGMFVLCIGFLFGAVSHPFLYFQF